MNAKGAPKPGAERCPLGAWGAVTGPAACNGAADAGPSADEGKFLPQVSLDHFGVVMVAANNSCYLISGDTMQLDLGAMR